MTTYDQPVEATLQVKLANGKAWEASAEDMERFGYVKRLDAYMSFQRHLTKVLLDAGLIRRELTEARVNPIRYIAELAINCPDLLDHPETAETDAEIVAIERHLQATMPVED
jgi:hypothetical protein